MSFRDLRNFTEAMRTLGYPRLISMENFRMPNFPLVAEVIVWLVKRIDSSADIPPEIGKEEDRVALIRSAAHLLALKASLKLNTKKLYQADGYAVRELLKVTNLLCESLKANQGDTQDNQDEPEVSVIETAMKVQEVQHTRHLVADIVKSGATLYQLLGKEAELRELRNSRASRHLEMGQVEAAIREATQRLTGEIQHTKQLMDSVASNEATLDSKIERKKSDLDRHVKRLQALKKIRPAFLEEFEKLEEELEVLYTDYVTKCRNVAYLESVMDQAEQAEQKRRDQKQAHSRKILDDMRQEDLSLKSGEIFGESGDLKVKSGGKQDQRMRTRTSEARETGAAPRRVFGSMAGGMDDSDSLDDSDSDLLLDGEITEDDELEIEPKPNKDISDDDF